MTQGIAGGTLPSAASAGAPAAASPSQAAAFTSQLQAQLLLQGTASTDPAGTGDQDHGLQQLLAGMGTGASATPGVPASTGVAGIPTISAQQLMQLQQGGGALGVQGMLAGMSPTVAGGYGAAASATTATPSRLTGDVDGLRPELRAGLEQVAQALGTPITIESGLRTRDEQAALYQRYLNGTGNLAAPPGHSNHESGNAADAYVNGVPLASVPGAAEACRAAGLHFPVHGEAWHVEHA